MAEKPSKMAHTKRSALTAAMKPRISVFIILQYTDFGRVIVLCFDFFGGVALAWEIQSTKNRLGAIATVERLPVGGKWKALPRQSAIYARTSWRCISAYGGNLVTFVKHKA